MRNLISKALSLSIGTKLTLTFIALIAITSIPLSFVVVQFSEKIYYENIVKSLKENIISEELQLRYYIINKDYWGLFKFVKGLSEKSSVYEASVVDSNGMVLAHSKPQKYPIGSPYRVKGDIVYPIRGLSSDLGSVILVLDNESIWAEFRPVKLFLMFSALPFTGISLFLGLFISYRIRARLSRIKGSIERINRGQLDELSRVEFLEKDELQEFSDFLFNTISTLRNYYENIDYAQRFYMNLLNTINEIVFVVDEEDKILYTNGRVRQLGYETNDLIGISIGRIVETREAGINFKGQKYREVMVKGRNGHTPALMGVVSYDTWKIITLIDISDRKAMEEKLKRMELLSTLGEMSANFAHELKNAMLPLRLLSSVENFSREDVEVIRNSLSRMSRLVNMFLNFAKPVNVEKTKFKLSLIVDEILFLVSSKVRDKDVELVKEVEDAELITSRDLIEIILINLLSNAVDAVGERGRVGVRAYVEEEVLNIEVWDTGEGISPEDMDRIFEPFYTTKDSGSGLGLAVVMKNVYMLGGNLQVSSQRGRGTTFKVKIPIKGVQDEKHSSD